MKPFLDRLRSGNVGAAAIVVAAGILLSRILGIVRDMIFAGMLGSDAVTDQYVAAFRIPDYANYLLAGGFLTITFIPIFAKYLADEDEEGGWDGFWSILRWLSIGISLLAIVAWIAAPSLIRSLYPDFTDGQVATTIRLTRIVLPAQFAFVVGAMFAAVQYAKGVFTIPTLAPIVYNVGIISGGVAWAATTGSPDPEGFIWGALAGAFVGNLALQVWGARRVGMPVRLAASWRHPAVKTYLLIAVPLMIGQSIVGLDEVFMSVFGSMVGEGAQTDLQYARRTMMVPIGVIAQAAAVAAYPTLARLFAEGRRAALLRTVDRALKHVLVLSLAAAGFVAALALPITRILYERGAFDARATDAVSAALFVYAFGIPVWGALQILTRAFYARRQMWTPVIVGTVITVPAIGAYIVAARSLGVEGVALVSVLSLAAYTTTLGVLWYRPADARAGFAGVARTMGRSIPLVVPAAAIAGGIGWAIAPGLSGPTWIWTLAALAIGAAAFAGAVLGIGGVFYDWLWRRDAQLGG